MKKTLFFLFLFFPFFPFCDLVYEFEGKTLVEGKKKEYLMKGKVFLKEPSYFRLEYEEIENPMLTKDSVILSQDLKTIYLLNKKEKTYIELNFSDMFQSLSGMADSLLNLGIEEPKVAVKKGREDKVILGYNCKHIIVESFYLLNMKILFMKSKQKISSLANYWVAENFPLILKDYFQEKSIKTGIDKLDELIELETANIKGMVLRYTKTTETKNDKGEATKTYEEVEVKKIEIGEFPLTYFEVPKDYKKIALTPLEYDKKEK